jgi:hypothetical protein
MKNQTLAISEHRYCGGAEGKLIKPTLHVSVSSVYNSYDHLLIATAGLRYRISSPFGFQHLTHTNREQFTASRDTSTNKSAGDFDERASQSPVKDASALHFNNFSSESLAAHGQQSPSGLSFRSPPQSPRRVNDLQQSASISQERGLGPVLRMSRSVESFSQPGVSLRNHRHSQSVVAPPRLSSLHPLVPINDAAEGSPHDGRRTSPGIPHSKRESGVWDYFSLETAPNRGDSSYVGHALTTPDETAIQAMTPPLFTPSLDCVAEEPERFIRPRPAPQPPTSPKYTSFDSSIFHNPRSPVSRRRLRGDSHLSPKSLNQKASVSRPTSQSSETLGCSDLVRRESYRRARDSHRQSNTWRVHEESWEDDIDYAYEHAMEADCDFEWDCASVEDLSEGKQIHPPETLHTERQIAPVTRQSSAALQAAFEPSLQHQTRDFRASLLYPMDTNVPDLEPTSATSSSTSGTGLTTPHDSFNRMTTTTGFSEGFLLSPSLLVPQEYKNDGGHSYEDLLNEYEDSERHFPLLDPRYSATSSARSRRSSYDSSLMSSAQSSAMWNSPVRRSASSAGSVPELVPSRRSRRDVTFSLVIDHLGDSAVALSHLDEEKEDSDITPPGHLLGNRTFFPADDAAEEHTTDGNSVVDELRASMEQARRGSQCTERSPVESETKLSLPLTRDNSQRSQRSFGRQHKQTRSDGAAKVLGTTSIASEGPLRKSRSRAATASQPARSPMLSLFPAPPRNYRS